MNSWPAGGRSVLVKVHSTLSPATRAMLTRAASRSVVMVLAPVVVHERPVSVQPSGTISRAVQVSPAAR